jgi:L-malate glycosyltransferase
LELYWKRSAFAAMNASANENHVPDWAPRARLGQNDPCPLCSPYFPSHWATMLERPASRAPRRLRILQIVSGDLWAGAETQFFQLVTALHDGREVEVRAAIMNPGILADRLVAKGVRTDIFDERRQTTPRIARRLCAIARDWRPSVVHTHRRKEHMLGGLAALASGANAVATIHGRNEFKHPWWRLRHSLLSSLEHLVLTHVHRRIIGVSEEMAGYLPGRPDRIVMIPNGIDVVAIRKASQQSSPPLPGRPGGRLAFIGRLEPVKRIDRIVDTLAALHAAEPGRWSLFILGEGSQRAAIEKRVRSWDLGAHVHMLGFTADPLPLLAQMDALVFASEHEGLPMTALEALALGVPVVSPAIGGLTRLVRDSGIGRIVSSDDPLDLAKAIRGAASANSQPSRPSAVPERYTINVSVRSHINVYRKLAGG